MCTIYTRGLLLTKSISRERIRKEEKNTVDSQSDCLLKLEKKYYTAKEEFRVGETVRPFVDFVEHYIVHM